MGGPILIGCQPCNTLSESLEVERYSVIKMHIRNNLTLFLHFSFIVSIMLNVFYRDYLVSKCLWAFPVLQKSLIIRSIAGLISMVADCQVTCHRKVWWGDEISTMIWLYSCCQPSGFRHDFFSWFYCKQSQFYWEHLLLQCVFYKRHKSMEPSKLSNKVFSLKVILTVYHG